MIDIVKAIIDFNQGRDPERLRMKYNKMCKSEFAFLRGTCHLYYARLPEHPMIDTAPPVWSCGDLHVENFGSYRDKDGFTYFDINDFDEAALAPSTSDVVRFLSSLLVGAVEMGFTPDEADGLCFKFLDAYVGALAAGKSPPVERATAHGLVHKLLDKAARRTRTDLLGDRTEGSGANRTIKIIAEKTLPAVAGSRERVVGILAPFAQTQPSPAFYEVIDVARRIKGTGSLGVERDVVLVRGEGGTDGQYLLDLKRALAPSLLARFAMPQPAWKNDATRVVGLERRMHAAAVKGLHPIAAADASYVLRVLVPSEDGITLDRDATSFGRIADAVESMGGVVASAQLRGAVDAPAATADELFAFSRTAHWRSGILELAMQCAQQVKLDWQAYRDACARHAFDIR